MISDVKGHCKLAIYTSAASIPRHRGLLPRDGLWCPGCGYHRLSLAWILDDVCKICVPDVRGPGDPGCSSTMELLLAFTVCSSQLVSTVL